VRPAPRCRNVSSIHPLVKTASAFHNIVDLVENRAGEEALAITNGNQLKAAGILGVNRATLRKKMTDD
jgi:DNA-binding protein Fis